MSSYRIPAHKVPLQPQSLFKPLLIPSLLSKLASSPSLLLQLHNSNFHVFLQFDGCQRKRSTHISHGAWRWDDADSTVVDSDASFERGVMLFNRGEYYECHDVLESLWYDAEEPMRSVLHGILQCSVGLYHLLNKNHRGAMAELGEGLAKLHRQRFGTGPFHYFEEDMAAVLEYVYNTQLEHAACSEDLCLLMDGSERSYQLLGNFAAGQRLYEIQMADNDQLYISFISPESKDPAASFPKVKLPLLKATADDLRGLVT